MSKKNFRKHQIFFLLVIIFITRGVAYSYFYPLPLNGVATSLQVTIVYIGKPPQYTLDVGDWKRHYLNPRLPRQNDRNLGSFFIQKKKIVVEEFSSYINSVERGALTQVWLASGGGDGTNFS